MFIVKYDEGKWEVPEIKPYGPLQLSPSISGLHYGQTIFEGMKAHRNKDGKVQLFRPHRNWERLNKSAERLCMPPVPEEIFMKGLNSLLNLDQDWVPKDTDCSLYIRPFYFAIDDYIGMKPSDAYYFVIFTCPVGPYYSEPVRIKIEKEYVRAAPGGVGAVKMGGNYALSMLATQNAKKEGYHNVIWLDSKNHKNVEEAGTMNLFFVIDGKVVTPPTEGTILDGITRESVIQASKDLGFVVEERQVSIDEVIEGFQNGRLTEAFGTGTAATVAPIVEIGNDDEKLTLKNVESWKIVPKIQEYFTNLKLGKSTDLHGWIQNI